MYEGWWSHNRLLRRGARGPDVARLRKALMDEGFDIGEGAYYDQDTALAVEAFQRRNRLIPDGYAGPVTLSVLHTGNFAFRIHEPKIVCQGNTWRCWASAMESVLHSGTWPSRGKATTDQLVERYRQHLDRLDGLPSNVFQRQVSNDFRLSGQLISGRQLAIGDILRLVRSRGGSHLLLMSWDRDVVGHTMVVYGMVIREGGQSLHVMDPWKCNLREMPMSEFQEKDYVMISMPRERVPGR